MEAGPSTELSSSASSHAPILRSKPSGRNIENIRAKSSANILPPGSTYRPQVTQDFLGEWLDFPINQKFNIFYSLVRMWFVWLIWNSKSMASLDPCDFSIRDRISGQLTALGSTAGLFLVIAVAGFLIPPPVETDEDRLLLDIYGVLMFASTVCFVFYIGYALTAYYPIMQSLRDDLVFNAYENLQRRIAGYDSYLFNGGMQLMTVALLVIAPTLYSTWAIYVLIGICLAGMGAITILTRELFISVDPISAMHLGLSNDPAVQHRAELISHYILQKIPNSIVDQGSGEAHVFSEKHESEKHRVIRHQEGAISAQQQQQEGDESPGVPVPIPVVGADDARVRRAVSPGSTGIDINSSSVLAAAPAASAVPAAADGNRMHIVDIECDSETAAASSLPSLKEIFVGSDSFILLQLSKLLNINDTIGNGGNSGGGGGGGLVSTEPAATYRGRGMGLLTQVEVEAVYHKLIKNGCATTEDLITYLNENRIFRHDTIDSHRNECADRAAGVWLNSFTVLDIPAFHAYKIIICLKQYLD